MSWARRLLRFSILRIVIAAVPIVAFTAGVSWLGATLGHLGVLVLLIAGAAAVRRERLGPQRAWSVR